MPSKVDYLKATPGYLPGEAFSPWLGCTPVGAGCDNCWARAWAERFRYEGFWGGGAARYFFGESHWQKPLRWQRKCERSGKRMRVAPFLCDPFEVLDAGHPRVLQLELERQRWLGLVRDTPLLDWLVLTKRPENLPLGLLQDMALPNLHLGVSVWDQASADRMVPLLLEAPAALRWVSFEPGLGPLDLTRWLRWHGKTKRAGEPSRYEPYPGESPGIDWLVVGCESHGPRPGRPCDWRWVSSLAKQCKSAGVPMFTKQLPDIRPGQNRLVKSQQLASEGWPVEMPNE